MAHHQITHVRPDGYDIDRRIDGFQIAGMYYPIDEVIAWIRQGAHTFYVSVYGRVVNVLARQHYHSGRWYLTTEGDAFPPNNLLNLPKV